MYMYKERIQYDGSLDKLKLRILVRGDFQNKEIIEDTWSPTASMRNLKYFLVDDSKHKERVHQFDFIVALLRDHLKQRVLWSWAADMETTCQNIETILEDH